MREGGPSRDRVVSPSVVTAAHVAGVSAARNFAQHALVGIHLIAHRVSTSTERRTNRIGTPVHLAKCNAGDG